MNTIGFTEIQNSAKTVPHPPPQTAASEPVRTEKTKWWRDVPIFSAIEIVVPLVICSIGCGVAGFCCGVHVGQQDVRKELNTAGYAVTYTVIDGTNVVGVATIGK